VRARRPPGRARARPERKRNRSKLKLVERSLVLARLRKGRVGVASHRWVVDRRRHQVVFAVGGFLRIVPRYDLAREGSFGISRQPQSRLEARHRPVRLYAHEPPVRPTSAHRAPNRL